MTKHNVRILKNTLTTILIVLIFCLSFIAICNFTFYFFYIETNVKGFSMYPTINVNVKDSNTPGDKILINTNEIGQVNDIVVAQVEWYDNYIIKRMVGCPGDKIEIKEFDDHFTLYVNDSELYSKSKTGQNAPFNRSGSIGYFEDYKTFLTDDKFQDFVETDGTSAYIKLDEDEYFLMGDNWGNTLDCLSHGPIHSKNIIGKVDLIIDSQNTSPFVPFNFFMKKIFLGY